MLVTYMWQVWWKTCMVTSLSFVKPLRLRKNVFHNVVNIRTEECSPENVTLEIKCS